MSKQLAEKFSEHRRLYGDGRQPTRRIRRRWAASAKTEKWNVFTTTTIIITTERNTV